jgi:hypothetical protein
MAILGLFARTNRVMGQAIRKKQASPTASSILANCVGRNRMSKIFWMDFREVGLENESEPSLIDNVSWQTVKEYFIKQAKEIEQSWLK